MVHLHNMRIVHMENKIMVYVVHIENINKDIP